MSVVAKTLPAVWLQRHFLRRRVLCGNNSTSIRFDAAKRPGLLRHYVKRRKSMDKKKTKIIVIVAAVCVVIAIAVGIAFAVRGSKEPEITVPANSMGADTPAPSESVGEVSTDEPLPPKRARSLRVPEGTTAEAKPTATKPHATAPTKKPTTTKVAPTKATGPVTNGENPFVEFDENGNPVPIGATDFRRSLAIASCMTIWRRMPRWISIRCVLNSAMTTLTGWCRCGKDSTAFHRLRNWRLP